MLFTSIFIQSFDPSNLVAISGPWRGINSRKPTRVRHYQSKVRFDLIAKCPIPSCCGILMNLW